MAETFGAVAGALSVAALFNNCVDCLGYIQLGRDFGRDFELSQLKLDITRSRISRWGEAVAVNTNPCFTNNGSEDVDSQQAWRILDQIRALFEKAQEKSTPYDHPADSRASALPELSPVVRNLHGHIERIVHQRQKQTGLLKKFKWAVYDKERLDELIRHITDLVGHLENLYPMETQRRNLAKSEIETINGEPSLSALKNAASGTDDLLAEAVAGKIEAIGKNETQNVLTEETARVKVGNYWSDSVLSRGVPVMDKTQNKAGAITARGASIVHVGTTFGGRGIFD
ncbi:hypothetical protein CEP54_002512 [Fusarium duplospermum]|uniref:Prion-inhibition and propagation HeLo domain-containing protein n=1 Tax=Fusarium duplospermum TaxID=1325734 RepID=A0A428QUW3_9HYPO|nr:hypothetical protein CEP54_002512 [Fusarium duplospermum]